jgi:hypothetical protein
MSATQFLERQGKGFLLNLWRVNSIVMLTGKKKYPVKCCAQRFQTHKKQPCCTRGGGSQGFSFLNSKGVRATVCNISVILQLPGGPNRRQIFFCHFTFSLCLSTTHTQRKYKRDCPTLSIRHPHHTASLHQLVKHKRLFFVCLLFQRSLVVFGKRRKVEKPRNSQMDTNGTGHDLI